MRIALALSAAVLAAACAPPEAVGDLGPVATRAEWPRILPLKDISDGAVTTTPDDASLNEALLARGAAAVAARPATAAEAEELLRRAAALRARAAALTGTVVEPDTRTRLEGGV